MAWDKYDAQRREIRYGNKFFQDLAVAELNPRASKTADEYEELLLKTRSTQVAQCAVQSWRCRRIGTTSSVFLPDMERNNANAFADWRRRTQYNDIVHPEQSSRYIVALHGTDPEVRTHDNRKVTAYARVESWRSNKGFGRFFGAHFPMITELESLDGSMTGRYAEDVAAVVSSALTESPSTAQAGVRVYTKDEAAIEFFGSLGFTPRGQNQVEGYAGAWTIDMVTAPDVSRVEVQYGLAERFPILQQSSGY